MKNYNEDTSVPTYILLILVFIVITAGVIGGINYKQEQDIKRYKEKLHRDSISKCRIDTVLTPDKKDTLYVR
jgi:hypothetical protein